MSPWLSDLSLRSQTDERLVALARTGHDRAFTAIVERYRGPLLSYARRIDPARAEDFVQQTFLSALTALQAGTEVRHLRGWLYEILRNLRTRDAAVVVAELDDAQPSTESAEQVVERRMFAREALGALAQLPPRQHNALLQVAIHGRSGSEVAGAMGLSEGAVRQLVHRARVAVREAVTAITPFPLIRWLASARSRVGYDLSDAALTAGTASTAGVAVKLGVGALVATGLVAGSVMSAGRPHHGHAPAGGRGLAGLATADRTSAAAAHRVSHHGAGSAQPGAPATTGGGRPSGRGGAGAARVEDGRHGSGQHSADGARSGSDDGSQAGAPTGSSGGPGPGSASGPGSTDLGGSGSPPAGSGSPPAGSGTTPGGSGTTPAGSGSTPSGGGSHDGSGSDGGSRSDGGEDVAQTAAATSSSDGGSTGSDGGSVTTGSSNSVPATGTDGGGTSGSTDGGSGPAGSTLTSSGPGPSGETSGSGGDPTGSSSSVSDSSGRGGGG